MKYTEAIFHIHPYSEAAGDVLAALLADIGFDTFMPTDEGLTAYVQTALFDEAVVDAVVSDFPVPDVVVDFTFTEAPDENWNVTWESEHTFEPINLPDGQQLTIIPRQAFGSGEHTTTQMMLRMLAQLDLNGKDIVDAGCGTGVLALAALKLGAAHAFAYDIDEWSVENARDNAKLNSIDMARLELRHGNASVLNPHCQADILLANINRNILLADMPTFVASILQGGHLLLSGFYEPDIPPLAAKAKMLGLTLAATDAEGEWRALHFTC